MRYRVRISRVCYGSVVVGAGSEEEAEEKASSMKVDYFDEETLDADAVPIVSEPCIVKE